MIGQFDSDGSGSLDRQEFLTLMMNKVIHQMIRLKSKFLDDQIKN